jgi:ribonucleoside-diphosphate reductase beta chain
VHDGADRTHGISLEGLYRQWEEASWSAAGIDFSADASQWRTDLSQRQRESARWNYAMFLTGVETVARAVAGAADAAPDWSSSILLAAQAADEARQRVFLDRFLREVAGQGTDPESTRSAAGHYTTWGFRQILDELDRTGDALRKRRHEREVLAQVVLLAHVLVEGVLGLPGQYFIQRYVEGRGILPGLSRGLAHIARDEARHVSFGVTLLNQLTRGDGDSRRAVVEMLDRVVPWTIGVFIPPHLDRSYVECFDFTLEEVYAYGLKSLESRISSIGVDPGELYLLARDDRSLSYEERAGRLLALIEAGVIGDDRKEPRLNARALEILFDATARSIDVDVARSVGGPIEWSFTDAEPWHLVVVDDHAEAKPGRAGTAALVLEISSGDWARIALGRADPRRALLTRRLRVHGAWPAKTRLPKLFG